jgi:hypothetical protein
MLWGQRLRRLLVIGCWLLPLAGAFVAQAAVWPDQIADFKKESSAIPALRDRALWDEYGLDQAEQARYSAGAARQFTGTAYRLQDPTCALAAFAGNRLVDAKPSKKLTEAAAETKDGVLFVFGNYLIRFEGWKPQLSEITPFLQHLPKLDQSPLPHIYLPSRGLAPNSERYILGPVGLDRFENGVPPAVAAFSMGAEGQVGQYDTSAGRMQLAVFAYPTPQIARQRLEAFQKLTGAMAKRAGPLVAVVLSPADQNAAEKLLSSVRYKATIVVDERMPTRRDNVGDLMVNIFILVGIILAIIIPAGILVGVFRRLGWGTSGDPMTILHLEDYHRE